MRVIAFVSLAFALAAFSMPLSARSNDVPATGQQTTGSLGAVGSEIGKATPNPSGNLGSVPKGGSGTPGLGSGTLGSRSDNIVSSAGGPNLLGTGVESSPQVSEAESTVGKASSATNPSTHNTRLRSRAATGSAPGAGTVVNELTGAANTLSSGAAGGTGSSAVNSLAAGSGPSVNALSSGAGSGAASSAVNALSSGAAGGTGSSAINSLAAGSGSSAVNALSQSGSSAQSGSAPV